MYFDWLTWSVWGLGLVLLAYWLFQATSEFREIISAQKKLLSNKGKEKSEDNNKYI